MSKGTKAVFVTAAVLIAVVAVFAVLNREHIAPKKEAQEAGFFIIHADGQEFAVSMDDILALSPFDITANYKPSGREPVTRIYQGVSLKSIVESLNIDYSGYRSVSFLAADGYASAISLNEAMDGGNCCIVISLDGEPLGTREDGGSGPFMMILPDDQFSQRWCKYLLEVNFQ